MIELPSSPSVARNRAPILDVLRGWLGCARTVLEVASGAGEHAVWFSSRLPGVAWQPSDASPEAVAVVEARRREAGPPNLSPPLLLDVAGPGAWPVEVDAVVAINLIHIAPWSATAGLMRGAAGALRPGGLLYLYGPFRETGRPFAASNAAFDAELRAQDATWGVRPLDAVAATAESHGLRFASKADMPSNNLSVAFRKP